LLLRGLYPLMDDLAVWPPWQDFDFLVSLSAPAVVSIVLEADHFPL
jgi:hypothetical protein